MKRVPFDTSDSPSILLEMVHQLKIKDVMTGGVTTAEKSMSLRDIQNLMKKQGITGVPIMDGDRLLGLISMNDIIEALDNGYIEESAGEHMTRRPIVLEEDMPLSFAIEYLNKFPYRRFPVLSKEKMLVGIVTNRDIVNRLLLEAKNEIERLEENLHSHSADVPHGSLHREFITQRFNFERAGKASTEIKKILKKHGLPRKLIRRIAVAAYELEINQVVHSKGGKMLFVLNEERVEITAADTGPGIPDVEAALREGFSTANDWIRSLGFGAGMGLPNVKRVTDDFSITSSPQGTVVHAVIEIPPPEEQEEKKKTKEGEEHREDQ